MTKASKKAEQAEKKRQFSESLIHLIGMVSGKSELMHLAHFTHVAKTHCYNYARVVSMLVKRVQEVGETFDVEAIALHKSLRKQKPASNRDGAVIVIREKEMIFEGVEMDES